MARQYDRVLDAADPTAKPRALVTAPLRGPGLAALGELVEVVHEPWIDQEPLRIYDPPGLADRAAKEGAEVLVVESDLVSGPVWDLPLLAVAATRGDPTNVDLPGATAAGVPVLHTPGRNADAVAELAVGLLIAVTRGIVAADEEVRAGEVFRDGTIPYQRHRSWELAGRTAGLIGLGAVGRALRWRLEALGMRVLAHDPYQPDAAAGLDELLEASDVVSLHAAVTPETRGLIGAAQFARMRPGAVFLNTARAALHDTDALVGALRSGRLAGAGIDHIEGEMLPPDHPLLTLPTVVLTPHIGGATYDTEARGAEMIAEDLRRLLSGEPPLRLANPDVAESPAWTGWGRR
jgi:D-3-phosphoglycerate dehydrogenase